jgi:hypothetical protein
MGIPTSRWRFPRSGAAVRAGVFAILALSAAPAVPQVRANRPSSPEFPPDIVIAQYRDVLQAAPRYYHVETENERTRVLRAHLPAHILTAPYEDHAGLLVAVTDVHLQYKTLDNRIIDISVAAGSTRWVDAASHTTENLSAHPCEFLFVEMKR